MGALKDFGNLIAGLKAIGAASRKSAEFQNTDDINLYKPITVTNGAIADLSFLWGEHSDKNLITLYHTIEEVFTPVNIIAKAVADGLPVVKKVSDDSVVYDNKYLNKIFGSPNPLQNWQQLVEQMVSFELVTGKNYLYANVPDPFKVNYKNIAALLNLSVDTVTIDVGESVKLLSATTISDLIKYFQVSDGSGMQVRVSPEKILYSKHNSLIASDMNILGRSPLAAANKAVEVLAAVYVALGAIYTKGGPRGMIVPRAGGTSTDVAYNPPDKNKVVEDVVKRYGFDKGQYSFGVTDQQVGWEKMGSDIQELQPKDIYRLCCAAIFNLYSVPRELMPDAQGATYENQKQARKSVYENLAIPRAKSFYQSLTTFLKTEDAGYYIDVDFSHINLLQENLKEKSEVDWKNNETYRIRFANGICTLNDWRVSCKSEPVTGNKMYDKLIYDMEPDELNKVKEIMSLGRGVSAAANDNSNPNNNGNGTN